MTSEMKRVPDEELAEIIARAERATPGPWTTEKPRKTGDGWSQGVIVAAVARGQGIYATPPGGSFPAADQTFIAAARTDVPRLAAELRRAREAIRDLLMICGEAHSESVYNALEEIKRARACVPDVDTSWQQKGDRAALEEPSDG